MNNDSRILNRASAQACKFSVLATLIRIETRRTKAPKKKTPSPFWVLVSGGISGYHERHLAWWMHPAMMENSDFIAIQNHPKKSQLR
jgi:hypothetical protein